MGWILRTKDEVLPDRIMKPKPRVNKARKRRPVHARTLPDIEDAKHREANRRAKMIKLE